MVVCEVAGIVIGWPIWSMLLPIHLISVIISYILTLAVIFFVSKLTKIPLIGPFISLVGDILLKIMLSFGLICLIIYLLCFAGKISI